jgi:hypothetical protein
MGEPERLSTRKPSCERLNCSLSTVERLIRRGEISGAHGAEDPHPRIRP